MEPKIVDMPRRTLAGLRIQTSLSENRTRELWQQFRALANGIPYAVGDCSFSVEIYPQGFRMEHLTPVTLFEKWAAVEVASFDSIPEPLELLTLEGGLYAVFVHRGTPADFPKTAARIFGQWLPAYAYELDDRPHFEIMGPAYRPDDPEAEEEVWVPVRKRFRV